MHFLYNLGIFIYTALIGLASPFSAKARLWKDGRKGWRHDLREWRRQNPGKLLWIHCASLGEFEQGRPVIERFRKDCEGLILLTFFSPSGYEPRKTYLLADKVMYLPADTPRNARDFVEITHPIVAVFVKYEFWANYLFQLKKNRIHCISVSTILRRDQRFFRNGAAFWQEVLRSLSHFFVQNQESADLLNSSGIREVTIAGDTRYDRVVEVASQPWSDRVLDSFTHGKDVLVVGSSYEAEERICSHLLPQKEDMVVIIAPHEIHEERLRQIEQRFPGKTARWSNGTPGPEVRILIIDSMGKLSMIYRYAHVVLIGGGFGKGIHNILEAAVYSVPVVFGPEWQRFDEARTLISSGGARCAATTSEAGDIILQWLNDKSAREISGAIAGQLTKDSTGATALVMNHLRTFFS